MDDTKKSQAGAGGAATGAATQPDAPATTDASRAQTQEDTPNYAATGEVFTNWYNEQVSKLSKPTVMLGTKQAEVIKLHPDGRLECEVDGAGSQNEKTFVVFDSKYLEQLLRRITALGF